MSIDEFGARQSMTEAAAAKTEAGFKVVELLLSKRGGQIRTTQRVLIAAVTNPAGTEIIELLRSKRGAQCRVTERVLLETVRN